MIGYSLLRRYTVEYVGLCSGGAFTTGAGGCLPDWMMMTVAVMPAEIAKLNAQIPTNTNGGIFSMVNFLDLEKVEKRIFPGLDHAPGRPVLASAPPTQKEHADGEEKQYELEH